MRVAIWIKEEGRILPIMIVKTRIIIIIIFVKWIKSKAATKLAKEELLYPKNLAMRFLKTRKAVSTRRACLLWLLSNSLVGLKVKSLGWVHLLIWHRLLSNWTSWALLLRLLTHTSTHNKHHQQQMHLTPLCLLALELALTIKTLLFNHYSNRSITTLTAVVVVSLRMRRTPAT